MTPSRGKLRGSRQRSSVHVGHIADQVQGLGFRVYGVLLGNVRA